MMNQDPRSAVVEAKVRGSFPLCSQLCLILSANVPVIK